jgi:hypothetical protein
MLILALCDILTYDSRRILFRSLVRKYSVPRLEPPSVHNSRSCHDMSENKVEYLDTDVLYQVKGRG